MRSYVAIHLSIILGVGVLVTGSIWAAASWGHWWVWDEPMLVSFLIVFLLYCVYQPLRFSIEDPERQARYASVFAITAGAFVPLNFIAVRMAQAFSHPRVLSHHGRQPARLDAAHLPRVARRDSAPVRHALEGRADLQERVRAAQAAASPARAVARGAPCRRCPGSAREDGSGPPDRPLMPALPLDEAGKYVAAAYLVVFTLDPDLRGDHGREARAHRARGESINELLDRSGE